MKRLGIFAVVIVLLILLGFWVLPSIIGLDRLLTPLKKNLESRLNTTLQYKSLRLTWSGHFGIEVSGLRMAPEGSEFPDRIFEAQTLKMRVQLLPLLKRHLLINSIELAKPRIHLTINREGKILAGGIGSGEGGKKAPSAPANTEREGETPPAKKLKGRGEKPVTFTIKSFKIRQADLHYHDEMAVPPLNLAINQIDANIKNFSLSTPIQVHAKMSLESPGQNLALQGEILLPNSKSDMLEVKHLGLDLNLSEMDLRLLEKDLGKPLPFEKQPQGDLRLSIPTLEIGPEGVHKIEGVTQIEHLALWIHGLASPIQNLSGSMDLHPQILQMRQVRGNFANGTLEASGHIQGWLQGHPSLEIEASAQQIDFGKLFSSDPSGPHFSGILSSSFKGRTPTTDWLHLAETLTGEGNLTIDRPVLVRMNILGEVLKKISVIPSLAERLESRLPEDFKDRLHHPDAVFQPIQQNFVLQNGVLFVNPLSLATDTFEVQGMLRYPFNGALDAPSTLILAPELSDAFIRSIHELSYLADSQGRVQIPFAIQGIPPDIKVFPDLKYIAAKIATTKAMESIEKAIQKKLGKARGPAADGGDQNPGQSSAPRSTLGQLLENVLTGPAQQDSTPGGTDPQTSSGPPKSNLLGQLLNSALQSQQSRDSSQTKSTS